MVGDRVRQPKNSDREKVEGRAITKIMRALKPLDASARARVIDQLNGGSNPEIEALVTLRRTMNSLNEQERDRVLNYFSQRHAPKEFVEEAEDA